MITKKGTISKVIDDKTVKVTVHTYRAHPKYKKRYRITKHFLVHNEGHNVEVGNEVMIYPCRPISKRKSWTLTAPVIETEK